MQIKTQLDIKLNQSDINEALVAYLALHGYNVAPDEVDNIKYVNTRNEGMTASLTVNTEADTAPAVVAQTPIIEIPHQELKVDLEPTEEIVDEPQGSPEDVMPGIDEIKAMQTKDEDKAPAVEEEPKTPINPHASLFGNRD